MAVRQTPNKCLCALGFQSTASTKSGTAIQTTAPSTAARTATARAIPTEIVSLLLAIAIVLFLHSRSANFTRAQEVGTGISLTLRQSRGTSMMTSGSTHHDRKRTALARHWYWRRSAACHFSCNIWLAQMVREFETFGEKLAACSGVDAANSSSDAPQQSDTQSGTNTPQGAIIAAKISAQVSKGAIRRQIWSGTDGELLEQPNR